MKAGYLVAAALVAAPAHAEPDLQARVAAKLREVGGPGTRFGLVVTRLDGREVIAIGPDARYLPASNTKIFTTAAVFDAGLNLDQADTASGARVRIEGRDVVIEGHGDARLSSAPDCASDCLATLADAVAAKTRVVRDVIGDDSVYPDERWGPGMSWEDLASRYGTAASALTLDDNELVVTVTPGAKAGDAPGIAAADYYRFDNGAVTAAAGETDLDTARAPGGDRVRLTGTVALSAAPKVLRLSIDDPAHYAAFRLADMLRARGVRVTGTIDARHRWPGPGDDPAKRGGAAVARPPALPALATAEPGPLIADITHTNKVSQNLHAELLLRRVGAVSGSGSIADGQARVSAMLDKAGVERWSYDFRDGSGMSTYNRVSPRNVTRFLRWAAAQPWGMAWRATLPVGGVDGTLARRYHGTALDGKLFAKTGTLTGSAALSGYFITAKGETLAFSSYANDMPSANETATKAVDAALLMVAAEN